jgi:hypothetical protein
MMVLRGEIKRPGDFIVINADPGMEDERSYGFVAQAKAQCKAEGIPFITAAGPNLWKDGVNLKASGRKWWNTPPLFCKKPNGKEGRISQQCTRYYKVEPMRRALRKYMYEQYGVNVRGRPFPVKVWIGFAADELDRVKKFTQGVQYITGVFPLVNPALTRADIERWYIKASVPKPPRSVCAACPANGIKYYEAMADERPNDFEKACQFDDAVRDLSHIGMKNPCYVSPALIGLRQMEERGFTADEKLGKFRCNSGVCFI